MYYVTYIFVVMSILSGQPEEEVKSYSIVRAKDPLTLTGSGVDPQWQSAIALSDFSYPWENGNPPLTTFQAVHDEDWVYLFYSVEDTTINVYVDKNEKSDIDASDRVEIFFRIDDKLTPYYGLEIDPKGRIMDYRATYHRKFDFNWSWPKGEIKVKTGTLKIGYTVEVAISKKSLTTLGLLKNNRIEAGIFRGDCIRLAGNEATIKWISWMKPASDTPDFHVPSAFGLLILEE